ncbi:4'-phosphopantetheinyl transferase family protein [Streptacidiphilus jiangxiensis]|uniref:4'-phosphopantetheinyl transferase family protein n=1 Tax=Streptacidiphilus jiangxiensis TaxID=235985 RepID=UPI0005A9B8FD|nr:4'-phosphopantetheinyl transferase superfamily protein [Streptacidiphilus jiangxiensis]
MLTEIAPTGVRVVEAFGDDTEEETPAEVRALLPAVAVVKRLKEFATARRCAMDALEALGAPAVPPAKLASGAPHWPTGVVGSITHTTGYRAVAVARSCDYRSLGVDAEPAVPLRPGLLEGVTCPEERAELLRLEAVDPQTPWDKLLFSAKEAVYKAWRPVVDTPLGFQDVRVGFDPESGRLRLRAARTGLPPLDGGYLVRSGLAVTAVWLPNR